jgi:hypothetical protein
VKSHVRHAVSEELALRRADTRDLDRRLRAFLRSDEAYRKYLPTETWLTGGCWLLAEALWHVLGGDLVAVVSDLNVEHVALRLGDRIVDGDGFSRPETLLRRWRVREGVPRPRIVDFEAVRAEVLRRGEIPPPDTRLSGLVRDLWQVLVVR